MNAQAPSTDVASALAGLARTDRGRLLSILMAILGDLQLAEDSLQDAFESALSHWQRNGVPSNPAAWLMQTSKRKAIDRVRRTANFKSKSTEIAHLIELENRAEEDEPEEAIRDERLKLIFTCCHPALDRKTAVALTLRSVCGLTTVEIARAFLDSPDAMAQRLVRARHKIARAGIRYEVPQPHYWPERIENVLAVIYLIFNEGYASGSDDYIRHELCDEAIRLSRTLDTLCPHQAEVEGLLALMMLHHARAATRLDVDGCTLSLEDQDRGLWNRDAIEEGVSLVEKALRRGKPGPYQLQAAISALHAEAPTFAETDWRQIALLYTGLMEISPNPVYALNRIVALSYIEGPAIALKMLQPIAPMLGHYQPFHALHADLLARIGRTDEARAAYGQAIGLSASPSERLFLIRRAERLSGSVPSGS